MTLRKAWTIELPSSPFGSGIGWDASRRSVYVADGWGVAFASLQVHRIDATTGALRASVRTRTSIRAFGSCIDDPDAMYFVGDKKVFVHGADDLDRRAVHDRRVPRYCNAIVDIGGGRVALLAPSALVELELATGRTRRVSSVKGLAIARAPTHVWAVLSEGTVLVRTDEWSECGSFGLPLISAAIDPERGRVVGLEEVPTSSTFDAWGNPKRGAQIASRTIHAVDLGPKGDNPWAPRTIELPFETHSIELIDGRLVAVVAGRPSTTIAVLDGDETRASWSYHTLADRPQGIVAFVGPLGVVTAVPNGDGAQLSLHALPD